MADDITMQHTCGGLQRVLVGARGNLKLAALAVETLPHMNTLHTMCDVTHQPAPPGALHGDSLGRKLLL